MTPAPHAWPTVGREVCVKGGHDTRTAQVWIGGSQARSLVSNSSVVLQRGAPLSPLRKT